MTVNIRRNVGTFVDVGELGDRGLEVGVVVDGWRVATGSFLLLLLLLVVSVVMTRAMAFGWMFFFGGVVFVV